jgi:hypothetical protein
MKTNILAAGLLLASFSLLGQGTFIYDQQSVNSDSTGAEGVATIQTSQPIGQSFTPSLDSMNFIRLYLGDRAFNSIGATVYINLRSNSITGPMFASTDPVFMPDGFVGRTNFYFPNLVSVTAGTTYYFQPVVASGDTWGILHDTQYNYSGGMTFALGQAAPSFDLWFREGIFIPEPSSALLLFTGAIFLVYGHRIRTIRLEGGHI